MCRHPTFGPCRHEVLVAVFDEVATFSVVFDDDDGVPGFHVQIIRSDGFEVDDDFGERTGHQTVGVVLKRMNTEPLS